MRYPISDFEFFNFILRDMESLAEMAATISVPLRTLENWMLRLDAMPERELPKSAARERFRDFGLSKRAFLLKPRRARGEQPYPILQVRIPPQVERIQSQSKHKNYAFTNTIRVSFRDYDNANVIWYMAAYSKLLHQFVTSFSLRFVGVYHVFDIDSQRYFDEPLSSHPLLILRKSSHEAIEERIKKEIKRLEGAYGKLVAITEAYYSPAKQ